MRLSGVKLVKAFGYDTARLYRHTRSTTPMVGKDAPTVETDTVPREFVEALELELTKQAGWHRMDNKVLFLFDYDYEHWAVKFHDTTATFVRWAWTDGKLPANILLPEEKHTLNGCGPGCPCGK